MPRPPGSGAGVRMVIVLNKKPAEQVPGPRKGARDDEEVLSTAVPYVPKTKSASHQCEGIIKTRNNDKKKGKVLLMSQ